MNNINNLFDKIIVNGININIDELIENNGIYSLPFGVNKAMVQYKFKSNIVPSNIFNNNSHIKKVIIPKTINRIENEAFNGNYNMSYVSLHDEISYIGYHAFTNTNITDDVIEQIQTLDPEQEIVVVYSETEANTYNYTLPNARKYGDIKVEAQEEILSYWKLNNNIYYEDPTYEISNSYDYIYNQSSWEESYTSGGLKLYYQDNPDKDRWNSQENRYGLQSDKIDGEWPEYCQHSWLGTINAPDAKLPWIVPHFDIDVNSKIMLQYEGKQDMTPWNNAKLFGFGNSFINYELASIPKEFNNNAFKITNIDGSGSEFDISKFSLIMIHAITGEERPCTYYDYIHDESSWNESYNYGTLKRYYEDNPYADLWNTVKNRIAEFDDRLYDVDIYEDIEWIDIIESGKFKTTKIDSSYQLITKVDNNEIQYYINVVAEVDNLYHEVFIKNDNDELESTGHYAHITELSYPNCIHCWEGAFNAPEAQYPLIIPNFINSDNDNYNVILRFEYDGLDSVYPFGSDTIFGNGNGHTNYGVISIPEIFEDDSFIIPEISNNESTFDINKFQMVLVHQGITYFGGQEAIDPILYEDYEIDEYNSTLDGAIHGGEPKNKSEEPTETQTETEPEPTNTYKYYLDETEQEEFDIDDLNLTTSEKITQFTLHPCSDDIVSVWIYPESWGYPSRIVDANNNECTAMWDNADDWMTVPEGYIGKYIANITSTCTFYVTWD